MSTSRPLRARRLTWRTLVLGIGLSLATHAMAWRLEGHKQVLAVTQSGERVAIGRVQFTPEAGGQVGFVLQLDSTRFQDHFLSMREFKCLTASAEISCHVPYPYPHPRRVTAQSLDWLSHELLFLYKQPKDYGAKLWNGVYYAFELTDQGLVGRPQSVDLNLISAPPDARDVPPYDAAAREPMPAGQRWLDHLLIE
jgi:hypothetical protein